MLKPASAARLALGLALALAALSGNAAGTDPAAIREQIRVFEAGTARFPPPILSALDPEGRPVYLFIAPCCDYWNRLYDAEGRFICAPSGGFTGAGDGKCPAWVHDEQRWRRLHHPAAADAPASGATGF